MPTYLIEGQKVKVDKPLSDAEIDEIATSIKGKAPLQSEQIPGQIPVDPNLQGPARTGELAGSPSIVDYAMMGAMAVPLTAGVARGAQLLSRGTKAAPYAANLAKAVIPQTGKQLAYEGALGAATGAAGGWAGEQVPEGWQRDLATVGAGAAAAIPFAAGRNIFDLWVNRGLSGAVGKEASTLMGQGRASAQAATAIRANPNLVPTLVRANEIEQRTGVSLPMLAAANGDTTISSFLQGQMAKGENAEFAAAMKSQYEAAEQALTKAQKGKAPSMQEVDAYVRRKALGLQKTNEELAAAQVKRSDSRQQGLENIDSRIKEITSQVTAPGRLDIGTRLTNLLSAKEASIRSELSPQYDKLIKEFADAGIVLPSAAAKDLKSFVTDETNDDVFAKFPTLYGQIKKEFRTPQKVSDKLAQKYTFAKEAPTAKDIPLTTLDSLKREVNKSIRDTDDKDQLRKLYLLKQEVDKAIDSVDPAFSVPYRALDAEYATRLGLPFSQQGVVNINRSKFVEETVPRMTRNAESLKQTLAVVGDDPDGVKLVQDAFLFDLSNNKGIISSTTGELNPKALTRYIATNKDKIDAVPGLRARLEQVGNNVQTFLDHRQAIFDAQKADQYKAVEDLWSKSFGTQEGIRGLVKSSLSNPAKLDQLMTVAGKDKVAREGIKAAMLEDVLSAQGDRLDLFTANKAAFDTVFGKQASNDIQYLVEASQRLKDNPFVFRMNVRTINKTAFEDAFGSKPETTAGELRNQIMTAPRVFLNHLSRYFQNRANKSEAAEVQKFLLDPKSLQQAAVMMKDIEQKGLTEKSLDVLKKMATNNSSAYMFGAMSGYLTGSQAPEPEQFTPIDPSLLEGFGQP
jgi:hypothetical protein